MCLRGSTPRKLTTTQKNMLGIPEQDNVYVISHTIMKEYNLYNCDEKDNVEYMDYIPEIQGYNLTLEPLPMCLCLLAGARLVRSTGNLTGTKQTDIKKYEQEWYDVALIKYGACVLDLLVFSPDQIKL
jgi:hypothetical protein